MKKVKRLVKLPPEVRKSFLAMRDADVRNSYIKVLRNEGWTLSSISEATGMTRERVRQITAITEIPTHLDPELLVPSLPDAPQKVKKTYIEPSPEILERLLELQPLAQQVRSNAERFREEAEEYTSLLWKAHNEQGVTLYRLAKRLGVTHSAIRFRLVRYGYIIPSDQAKSKVYVPINPANRKKAKLTLI